MVANLFFMHVESLLPSKQHFVVNYPNTAKGLSKVLFLLGCWVKTILVGSVRHSYNIHLISVNCKYRLHPRPKRRGFTRRIDKMPKSQ